MKKRHMTLIVLIFSNIFFCFGQSNDTTKTLTQSPKVTFELKGRQIVSYPNNPKDTFEKGIVVVEIVVDKNGKVIKAKPGLAGSTTTKATLLAKARQTALQTKFNAISETIEQVGTLTIAIDLDK